MQYEVRVGDKCFDVEIDGVAPRYSVRIDGRQLELDAERLGDASLLSILLDSQSYLAHVVPLDARRGQLGVSIAGKYARLEVLDPLSVLAEQMHAPSNANSYVLEAPMPGLVVAVHVAPGDRVEVGTALLVIEAMKMQNELTSDVAGTVLEVRAAVQQAVESGTPLVSIEADAPST